MRRSDTREALTLRTGVRAGDQRHKWCFTSCMNQYNNKDTCIAACDGCGVWD
jgi:hypothetical protein